MSYSNYAAITSTTVVIFKWTLQTFKWTLKVTLNRRLRGKSGNEINMLKMLFPIKHDIYIFESID